MLVDTETRLGMQLATFVPAEDASGYRFPSVSGGVTPTVQAFVGGNTDRNTPGGLRQSPEARRGSR